jgi:hypothetical protein
MSASVQRRLPNPAQARAGRPRNEVSCVNFMEHAGPGRRPVPVEPGKPLPAPWLILKTRLAEDIIDVYNKSGACQRRFKEDSGATERQGKG